MKRLAVALCLLATPALARTQWPTINEQLPPCAGTWTAEPDMRAWLQTPGDPRFMVENPGADDHLLINVVWPDGIIYLRVPIHRAAYLVCVG